MKGQFNIGSYRIDLYIPAHKLATNCGEYDHKDKDIGYEIKQQKFIEDQLTCMFITYNFVATCYSS